MSSIRFLVLVIRVEDNAFYGLRGLYMQDMHKHEQKRILVELLHGMGDTVCAIPMLKVLREHYQEARIDVVCKFDVCVQILQCSGIKIDNYYVVNVFGNPVKFCKFMILCKKIGYDYAIASPHTPVLKAKFFMDFAVSPRIWFGIQKKNVFFDTLPVECHHVKAHLMALQGLIDGNFEHICPELYPENHYSYSNIDFFNEFKRMENIVGVCIGNADFTYKYKFLRCGKVYTRGWGTVNMRKLIKRLLENDIHVVLMGGKHEEALLSNLGNGILLSDKVINMVGKTTIVESMLVAKQCRCVVGVDTGMIHIADAVGISTVSIFGPTDPYTHGAYSDKACFVYHPGCCNKAPCYGSKEYSWCEDRKCLNSISVNEVYKCVVESYHSNIDTNTI